jgi:hypothetical protein
MQLRKWVLKSRSSRTSICEQRERGRRRRAGPSDGEMEPVRIAQQNRCQHHTITRHGLASLSSLFRSSPGPCPCFGPQALSPKCPDAATHAPTKGLHGLAVAFAGRIFLLTTLNSHQRSKSLVLSFVLASYRVRRLTVTNSGRK